MKRRCLLLTALLLGCFSLIRVYSVPAAAGPGTFFVGPGGNDQWSGHRASANWTRTDGPFATLPRALAAARQRKQPSGAPATILLRGGLYLLSEPLVLKPEDSGLVIAAYGKEKPIISGGRLIHGWKPATIDGRELWAADLPEVRKGNWDFRELWVNGRRAVRARHPNHGYFKVAGVPQATPSWSEGQTSFRFEPGDLRQWKTVTDAEVVVMNRWVESRLPVFSVDEAGRMVHFEKRAVFQLQAGDPYYLEGALEALDQPGEWYLDRHAGTLYYLPRPGEKPRPLEAIAPCLVQVVRIEGQPDAGQFVQQVVMRDLTFAHTEWYFPPGYHRGVPKESMVNTEAGGFAQAAVGVPGAVTARGARECGWERCAFEQLGNYGLELARGCQSNRVLNCEFADLGAGGVKLGETAIRGQSSDQTRANDVTGCHIHDGAKLFHSAIGIWVGQSPDNRLTSNLIHDFYYTGISIGWTWGYGTSLASNNYVAFNHVHHIGRKSDGDGPILSDMGGIYTLGMQPGTRILNNLWHDIAGLRYGGWGIYFDEGSSGILAESNLVYRTTHGGFHQHYGATNLVYNNIFAFGRDQQLQRTRPEPHLSFSFQTNIVYFDSGAVLGGDWSGDHYQMDANIYFDARPDATPGTIRFAGATLDQWRARGHDLHSLIADPLFVGPQQNDFRLRTNSLALQRGFQPLDLSRVP